MKIWEKIYLIVMVVFLVVVGVTNTLVFRSSYQNSVDAIEKAGILGWKRIAVALAEDLTETLQGTEEEWDLFQNYVSVYGTDVQAFEIWEKETLQYKSQFGTQMTFSAQEGLLNSDFQQIEREMTEGEISIIAREGEKYTCAIGGLEGTDYQFVIYERVTDVLQVWKEEIGFFLFLELVAAIVMAILLYAIMRRFLRPISEISQATAKIAAGDYEHRVKCQGQDELSLLAEDINRMTVKVQEHVEEKEQEAEQKQEFIDALSHELRTPLTSIQGYAQLVQNASLTEEKKQEYISDIVHESKRMLDITEVLREVILLRQETVEMDRVPMDKVPMDKVSIEELAKQLYRYRDSQIEEKKIHIEIKTSQGTIWGNQTLLEELLLNLFRNSIHACEEKGRIEIKISPKEILIQDNGIGMTKETIEHIFEPFYREDKARSRKLGGSGLGMYLCHQIIKLHDWKIEIQSQKGNGTTIKLYNFFTKS